MIPRISLILLILSFADSIFAQEISNVHAAQQEETILITYDLNSASNKLFVRAYASTDNGTNYNIGISDASGDVNRLIKPGTRKSIIWNAKREVGEYKGEMKFRVVCYSDAVLGKSENSDFLFTITDIRPHSNNRYMLSFSFLAKKEIATRISEKSFMLDNFGNSFKLASIIMDRSTAINSETFAASKEYHGDLLFDLAKLNPGFRKGEATEFQLRIFYGNSGSLYFERIPVRQ